MTHPVSVQIITLNEEATIAACITSVLANDPAEIIVIDGGSIDATVEIAKSMGVQVLTPGQLGRGASRRLGYHSASQPYSAMVDADDRIAEDWVEVSLRELRAGSYSGLQSRLRVLDPQSWWERGWDQYFLESIKPVADTIMVGHPAIYVTKDLQESRDDIGHDHEDTQLSVDFQSRGLRQGIGTAVSYRVCPNTRAENLYKWHFYGKGYRDFVDKHPDRRSAILKHMLITIPFVRGWRPVARGKFMQPVFASVMAATILAGYLRHKR